jgi:N-acetylmuramoyl-L-alanine amidase
MGTPALFESGRPVLVAPPSPRPQMGTSALVAWNCSTEQARTSIHHDSVPDNLKEVWQYEGKKSYYSDRFSGYAIFVSNDNADRAGILAFGHSLGQELQKRGLHYTPHYALPLMGRYRHELVDEEAGVYRYDHLLVLHSTFMPAVLLEAGSIVNRQEELELATPERRLMVAEVVTAAVEVLCEPGASCRWSTAGEQASQCCNHHAFQRHQADLTLASSAHSFRKNVVASARAQALDRAEFACRPGSARSAERNSVKGLGLEAPDAAIPSWPI